jgi:hypothetical protein
MTTRTARGLLIAYLASYAIVLTWPGVLPFNHARPFILGMPFILVWVAGWVALGGIVLHVLERATTREEDAASRARDAQREQS